MQRRIIKSAQPLWSQYDDVQTAEAVPMMPKGLTSDTLYSVAVYGAADIFLGNDQAQPTLIQTVRSGQKQKTGSRCLAGGSIEYCLELSRRQ